MKCDSCETIDPRDFGFDHGTCIHCLVDLKDLKKINNKLKTVANKDRRYELNVAKRNALWRINFRKENVELNAKKRKK